MLRQRLKRIDLAQQISLGWNGRKAKLPSISQCVHGYIDSTPVWVSVLFNNEMKIILIRLIYCINYIVSTKRVVKSFILSKSHHSLSPRDFLKKHNYT